jgi:hypothetical protein
VKVGGIAITVDGPILLGTLKVELLIHGKELVVLAGEVILKIKVLLMRWFGLLVSELVLYGGKLVG